MCHAEKISGLVATWGNDIEGAEDEILGGTGRVGSEREDRVHSSGCVCRDVTSSKLETRRQ